MKILKKALFILSGLILLLGSTAYLILSYNSKEILQEIVSQASKDKYKLEAKKVSLFFYHAGIAAEKVTIIPVSRAPRQTTLSFDKLEIRLSSFLGLLFRKNLEVLKLELIKPDLTTYAKQNSGSAKKGIAETIDQIQTTLLQSIAVLNVKDVNISDASLKVYAADTLTNSFLSVNHINLHLNDIYLDGQAGQKGETISMKGALTLLNPAIHLTDSNVIVSVNRLEASVTHKSLIIDSLDLKIRGASKRLQHIKLSNLTISHFNWDRYLKEGVIELDSVLVRRGMANISIPKKNLQQKDSATPQKMLYSGGTFLLHHTFISDISYTLHTRNKGQDADNRITLDVDGDSMYLQELSIVHEREPAFNVENLRLRLRDFKKSDDNRNVHISFGTMALDTQTLILKDYLFETNKDNLVKNYFRVAVPEFRLNNYDLEEVLKKQLSATSIQLLNPDITIDIRQAKKENKEKKDIDKVFSGLMQKVSGKASLQEIAIENGNFTVFPTLSPEDKININGLSLVMDAGKFPEINDAHDFINAIKRLDSKGFVMKGKNMELTITNMALLKSPRGLHFGSIKGNFGEGKNVDLKGVTVLINDSISNYKRTSNFHASAIFVESGSVSLELLKKGGNPKKGGSTPSLLVDTLNLKNVMFSMKQGQTTGISAALNIMAKDLVFRDKDLYWTSLGIHAANPDAAHENTNFNAGNLSIIQPGIIQIRNASGNKTTPQSSISFSTRALDINLAISSTAWPSLKIDAIEMTKPQLNINIFRKEKLAEASFKAGKPFNEDISLKRLMITEPTIDLTITDIENKQIHKHKVYTGYFLLEDIHSLNQPEINIGKLVYKTTNPKVEFKGLQLNPSAFQLGLSDLKYNTITKQFSLHVDTVQVENIGHTIVGKKNDTLNMQAKTVGLGNFNYAKGDSLTLDKILYHTNWWVKGGNIKYNTTAKSISAWKMNASGNSSVSLSLDSFAILNTLPRDSVWLASPYEKGYETIRGGKLSVSDIRMQIVDKKPVVEVGKMTTHNIHFTTAKDKTKLEDTIDYRPLLTQMFTRIPIQLKVDSLLLNKARVDAHEISKKTGKETHIYFTEIDGYLKNVKTWDIQEKDTLYMRVRARFYGTDQLRLHFKQSYDDTLQGFWMRVRMSHFNMPEMNKLLTPLMGLKIHSGTIDSLLLVANGNDYFAYGSMDLRFHDLQARVVKTGESKGRWLISIENFFAGIILRKHDNGRTNLLFKERLRKRSIFNFWAKIGLEGLLTNLGIKRDKAERKQFEKNVEKYKLPEKYWEDIDDLTP